MMMEDKILLIGLISIGIVIGEVADALFMWIRYGL